MFANHGALKKHFHKQPGINSRMDVTTAVLNVKLNYITEWTSMRVKNASIYNQLLEKVQELKFPKLLKTPSMFITYTL